MASTNMPAVWVPLEHTRHALGNVECRTCGWRGYGPDRYMSESEREQGARHAAAHRGHVVVLAEQTVSLCVAPDVVFTINPTPP